MQRKDGRASKVLGCFGFIVFIYVTGFIVYEVIPWVTRWVASGVHSLPILGDLTVFIGRVLRGGLVLGLAFVLGAVSWLSGRALLRMTVADEDFDATPRWVEWSQRIAFLVLGMGFWVVPFGAASVAMVLMLVEMETGVSMMPAWMRPFLDIVLETR